MFPVTWISRGGVIVRHVARRFRRSWERSRARRLGCICSRSHFSRIVCHIWLEWALGHFWRLRC
jgi:hypothetical protein